MKKEGCLLLCLLLFPLVVAASIDRRALVGRHSPHLTHIDTLASLSVGNGEFAVTCDVTGLQTFHRLYAHGVPLGTMAQWGWHSFPNTANYKPEEVLRPFDFGRQSSEELYSCQLKDERGKAASDYLRANPHRLHLGLLTFDGMEPQQLSDIHQQLDLWNGMLHSRYRCQGKPVNVETFVHPDHDCVVARIDDPSHHAVRLLFPYPTGKHSDDACDWAATRPHQVCAVGQTHTFCHTLDGQSYYLTITCQGAQEPTLQGNEIVVQPTQRKWAIAVEFTPTNPYLPTSSTLSPAKDGNVSLLTDPTGSQAVTRDYWHRFWTEGAAVDMSRCTDPRAKELERRIVLSQYLTAIQCAGSTPPQETGLTYNSWFGKFHLEMTWWHQAHFAFWGHPELLARTLPWYHRALPMAQEIAHRQGFEGARWMKMTDPSAAEAPSNTGSFLIWQQPHLIYLAELLRRADYQGPIPHVATPSTGDSWSRYLGPLVDETARFMASYISRDSLNQRYVIKGSIPAQETLKAATTVNPPFELAYWHFALSIAQQWRERQGLARQPQWDDILRNLSPLTEKEGIYTASEDSPSYPSLLRMVQASGQQDATANGPFEASELNGAIRLFSDHPAVLCACGVLPIPPTEGPDAARQPLYDLQHMRATLEWVMKNWNWDKTWGWDFPTVCMTAVRCGEPEMAIEAILKDVRTNTYLPNGHNYQDSRLRCYLPGNGGLLTAVALMCAGYDGCTTPLPGFPKNGRWNVVYEGLRPLP